ncbi:MAG: amidohydrolase family protein [Oscillospiraceae bacterium]|nr:amidohydrolase family protein [Oscillospiraceae bacterium]
MIEFIDACTRFGHSRRPVNGIVRDRGFVTKVMDSCGIKASVVYHAAAEEGDISLGNERLIDEVSGDERFIPQWIVVPKTFDDGLDPYILLGEMKKNGVKCARIAPKSQGFSLGRNASDALVDALAECNIPIFANENQLGKSGIYDMCKRYPRAKFIITNAGYGALREYFSLLEECRNLTIETGSFVDHGGISLVCDRFGAERLVFGSCSLSMSSVGDARGFIMYSEISEEEKKMIAGQNIKKLLSEVAI